MLKQQTFWEKEGEAPLMGKNRGFLKKGEEETKAVMERANKWKGIMNVTEDPEAKAFEKFEITGEPERIFVKDAERTFFSDENRLNLIRVLSFLSKKFGDYHQGLSYVTSFLLLTHDVNTTIEMLMFMNKNEKFIPGYWRAEAVAFATDSYVFDSLLQKQFPEVHQQLAKNFVFPETYAQKWFIGLCVHVLPFNALFTFFEQFLQTGYTFLFQFGLSLVSQTKEQILKAKTAAEIYAILRLDTKEEELSLTIVEKASTFDVSGINFVEQRKKQFEEKLKARLERAAQQHAQKSDSDDDLSGSDGEGGEECLICHENFPEYYCSTCKLLLCEGCHKGGKQPHQKSHKVKSTDEVDMDAIVKEMGNLDLKKEKPKGKEEKSDEE